MSYKKPKSHIHFKTIEKCSAHEKQINEEKTTQPTECIHKVAKQRQRVTAKCIGKTAAKETNTGPSIMK